MNYEAASEADLINQWELLRRYKTWPVAGGLDDQMPLVVEAVQIIELELAKLKKQVKNGRRKQANSHGRIPR